MMKGKLCPYIGICKVRFNGINGFLRFITLFIKAYEEDNYEKI
jgi:hypothetical protein